MMSQSQKAILRLVPMLTVMLLLVSSFLIQGFVQSPPSGPALRSGQEQSQRDLKSVKVQPGIILKIKFGTIVGVSIEKAIPSKAKWYDLIGSKYVIGDIHATDVTPLLWRKLEVRLKKRNDSISEITMLRPLWWMELTRAKEGGYLDLIAPEAGLKGVAKVVKISPCYADSINTKTGHLVIGKIKHQNAKIIQISFVASKDQLGVTPNHLLYSLTHGKWIAAGVLKKGDRLKTANGKPVIVAAINKGQKRIVYNLEVHRAESYFVGSGKILAHNTSVQCDIFERTWRQAGMAESDARRIQNAADKTRQTIIVVGSRAKSPLERAGKVPNDWDYLLYGNARQRSRVKNSLPRGSSGGGHTGMIESGIDIWNAYPKTGSRFGPTLLDPSRPHVIFKPR